jgi:hypothetical protein
MGARSMDGKTRKESQASYAKALINLGVKD